MTEGSLDALRRLDIFEDQGFRNEVAQVRSHAALVALPGEQRDVRWTYDLSRLLKNATAALIDLNFVMSVANTGGDLDFVSRARRLGQIWESISRVVIGPQQFSATVNAMLAYELAGYQANAACLSRELMRKPLGSEAPRLPLLTGFFFRRQFLQAERLALDILDTVPTDADDLDVLELAAQGLIASATIDACRFFLQGSEGSFSRALERLTLATQMLAATGSISKHSLARMLLSVLPHMRGRSTWAQLHGLHPQNALWTRYLLLLARGLGQRIEENAGIVELWPSQIAAIENGLFEHPSAAVIRMPTSAGKTRIAELAIVELLVSRPGARCVYVTPFRSLASEVESALKGLMSDLGFRLSTTLGSFESNSAELEILEQADLVIATPEKLDLLSRTNQEFFDSVALVVIDEGQLVEDQSRGPKFELFLGRLRSGWPDIRFIFLSAVIPDSSLDAVAAWLGDRGGMVARSDWRPAIQRHAIFQWREKRGFVQFFPDSDATGIEEFVPGVVEQNQFRFQNPQTLRMNSKRFPDVTNKAQTAAELAYQFAATGSVLVFCASRRSTIAVSDALMERIEFTERAGEAVVPQFNARQIRSAEISKDWLGEDHSLTRKLQRGIAVHHAGIPDVIQRAIEQDFRERRFSVIVATSTLAQGVNLPIRTVIIHSTSRYANGTSIPMSAREYWNISGRAGRAGFETEGLILHLCISDGDFRSARLYARRRSDLEPISSALASYLIQLVHDRISEESLWPLLDSPLLALLVEEDATEVTDEWISKVFASTLASLELGTDPDNQSAAKAALRRLADTVLSRVPDSEVRKLFADTGLSVDGCSAILSKIQARGTELGEVLTGRQEQTREQLIELVLTDCFAAEEIRPRVEPVFELTSLANAWVSGESSRRLSDMFSDDETPPETIAEIVEDTFQFGLPWGITAYLKIAARELGIDESDFAPVVKYLAPMFKFGVPTVAAVWAVSLGIQYRSVAIRLSQAYERVALRPTLSGFAAWLAEWQIDELVARYQLTGPAIENIAATLRGLSRNSVVEQFVQLGDEVFPIGAQIVVSDPIAIIKTEDLQIGEHVRLIRDYDAVYDRNAISGEVNAEHLGMLSGEVAQFLAPMMDVGNRYYGVVESIHSEGTVRRVFIQVTPN